MQPLCAEHVGLTPCLAHGTYNHYSSTRLPQCWPATCQRACTPCRAADSSEVPVVEASLILPPTPYSDRHCKEHTSSSGKQQAQGAATSSPDPRTSSSTKHNNNDNSESSKRSKTRRDGAFKYAQFGHSRFSRGSGHLCYGQFAGGLEVFYVKPDDSGGGPSGSGRCNLHGT